MIHASHYDSRNKKNKDEQEFYKVKAKMKDAKH